MTPSITEVVAERYRVGTWKGGNYWRNFPLFHVWGLSRVRQGINFVWATAEGLADRVRAGHGRGNLREWA
jgi:hypothetical protein